MLQRSINLKIKEEEHEKAVAYFNVDRNSRRRLIC